MIEMEIFVHKNEQGLVTHVMDICYFRKKRMPSMSTMTKRGVEAANENDHERSLICWSAQLLSNHSNWMFYLFFGPINGQNFVHSLHLKWVPMFLAILFLLLNSHVRMYVRCTVKYLFGSFSGSSNLSPKLRWWDLWWAHTMDHWRRLAGTSTMVR